MALPVRFDTTGPYEVEQTDTPFARPDGIELLARVYRPLGEPERPLGAVVYVHGGAWARLDRTADPILCGALAASGAVVIALDFRQAPDHRYPAAGADVAAGARDASVAFAVALYPVADPLARYRYALSREDEPPPPSGFDANRLIASHRAFFADEAAMAATSVTRIVSAGEATALPPVWVGQPDQDDNVPAAITEAFVRAYRGAGGQVEHAHFPDARHGFTQQASPDTDKGVALIRDFV